MASEANTPVTHDDDLKLLSEYQTERLILRLSSGTLAAKVTEYFIRNRDFLCDTQTRRPEEYFTSLHQHILLCADEDAFLRGTAAKYWIFEQNGRDIIGMVALSNITKGAFNSCFLSYRLDHRFTGKGYALEAVKKMVSVAFNTLGLRRIEAIIMPRNTRAIALVEKLGFECEGKSRSYLGIRGRWEDHLHMTLLRDGEG